jgi:hypothetical protein
MNWSLGAIAVFLPLLAFGQEPDADAEAKLAANGFVILDYPLKQGFSAYINSRHPNFVTSDSLLMAYHRLFEEFTSRRNIDQMAAQLRLWPALWKNLPPKSSSAESVEIEGHHRSRLLVGTAFRLLFGDLPEGLSDEERTAITEEVTRVEKGEGDRVPAWLQSTKDAPTFVPYQSFLPASFGDGVPLLERYYRCRKWLQEIKLDANHEPTCSMLEQVVLASRGLDPEIIAPFEDDNTKSVVSLMPSHDPDDDDTDARPEQRSELRSALKDHKSWTMLASTTPIGSEQARELLRHGDASRLPEVIGAAAGNSLARLLTNGPQKAAAKRGWDCEAEDESYVSVLVELNKQPDPRAPALMRSEAWKRKQLNATLGSWTEYRYALQLASREDAFLGGSTREEPGFVEPIPAFYRALGHQVEYLSRKLSEENAPGISQCNGLAVRLAKLASALANAEAPKDGDGRSGNRLVLANVELLTRLFPQAGGKNRPLEPWEWVNPALVDEVSRLIPPLVAGYWKGEKAAIETLRNATWREHDKLSRNLALLASMCFRLEALTERQLAGQPIPDDAFFIQNVGMHLAEVMFYEGNSYLSPLDDAPRIVRYASLARPDGIRISQAATARPKLMLIRYPDREGKEVLCQGAVYAFRNLERDHSLTLPEWREAAEKEPWPFWMDPITGKAKPEKRER